MTEARQRLAAARTTLAADLPNAAVSSAYYAMLYAARAALSEEDRFAKTHRGTWDLFREAFVEPGRFDRELALEARRAQRPREAADYDAQVIPREQAEEIVLLAERFVTAIDVMFGA
jgi:uncharacterized protein (UPF0332 family)